METLISFITKKEVYGLLITAIIVYLLDRLFNKIVDRIASKGKTELEKKKKKTIVQLIKNIKKYGLIIIGSIIILDLYGINVSSIVASLGVASAVGALALQDTLKDIISGAAIIMDNYYIVGDYVEYNGFRGHIISLGLRSTQIESLDGQIYTVANRNISEIVRIPDGYAGITISVPTAYEEKVEDVESVIKEIIEEMKTWEEIDKNKTKYLGITELADSSVNYLIMFATDKTKILQYKRDALRLIKMKYDERGIKIPYNQIEVHNGK